MYELIQLYIKKWIARFVFAMWKFIELYNESLELRFFVTPIIGFVIGLFLLVYPFLWKWFIAFSVIGMIFILALSAYKRRQWAKEDRE